MAAVVIQNVHVVPSGGTYNQFAGLTFSPVSALTAMAGIFDTIPGRFFVKFGNGINGGVPNQGPRVFVLTGLSKSASAFIGPATPSSGSGPLIVIVAM